MKSDKESTRSIMNLTSRSAVLMAFMLTYAATDAEESAIVVHADKIKGQVERNIIGSELKCLAGAQGLMTGLRGQKNDFRPSVMEMVDCVKPEFMRYKFIRNKWNWEDGIGPMAARKDDSAKQKFMGIDEIMAFQSHVVKDGSKCQLVVNPKNAEQSAALVAYLNIPADDPVKNRHDQVIGISKENDRDYKTIGYWAKLRAENGHTEPYGVKWFELGNENYMKKDIYYQGNAEAYCAGAKAVAAAMKAVDPSIFCGVNTEAYPTKHQEWRDVILKNGSTFADFVICHAYYPLGYPRNSHFGPSVKNMEKMKVEELYYKMVMAGAHQGLSDWRWLRGQLKAISPRADELPLCLTENGFHLEIHDAMAQNTVLVGVYNTDLIGAMIEHADELKLRNANLFYLQGDDNWCLIQHPFEKSDSGKVIVRPSFYALYMWTHFFGTSLLTTTVECGTFDIPLAEGGDWPKEKNLWSQIAAQDGIPLLTAHSSLSADGKTLYMIVVNRGLYDDVDARVDLKNFSPQAEARVHTLNTSLTAHSKKIEEMFAVWDSNNEDSNDVVKIRESAIKNAGETFRHVFPAHSATAIVLKKK
jgi:alpha-L-arabinofuranosidase